jgi:hypothetical protein
MGRAKEIHARAESIRRRHRVEDKMIKMVRGQAKVVDKDRNAERQEEMLDSLLGDTGKGKDAKEKDQAGKGKGKDAEPEEAPQP